MGRRVRPNILTGWSIMWVICMFDCPVGSQTEMRMATRFRNALLDYGFVMKQFSVYIKPCTTLDTAKNLTKKIKPIIPQNGSVSFMYVTDKQYTMTDNFIGKYYEPNEETMREKNGQYLLF